MAKKKRKWKKKPLFFFFGILLFLLLLWVLLGVYLSNHPSQEAQLKKLGYSKEERDIFQEKLSEKDIETILEMDYQKNLIHILEEKNFEEKYFTYYLKFLDLYPTAPVEDVVFLVNHGKDELPYTPDIHTILTHPEFQEELLDRYLTYYQKYETEGNLTIQAVNEGLDEEDILLDDVVQLFLGQEYTILKNMDRYKNYYATHKDLAIKEIITRVNINLDKTFYEDITPTDLSKENLIIVNKYYYLKKDYEPENLVAISSTYGTGYIKKEVLEAFKEMYNDAVKVGLYPYIQSPYRSYSRQSTLYNNYVSRDGKTLADTYSARPGYSEHQTGLAMDLGTKQNHSISAFENSKEFTWVKENAYKYGFILRYPKGKEYITGYMYEPWHYRYVGKDVAKYIHDHNITFEEYYAYFVK